MKSKIIILILCAVFISSTQTFSWADEVYSWTDKNGTHYVDDPSKIPAKYRNKRKQRDEYSTTSKSDRSPDRAKLVVAETEYKGAAAICINNYKYDQPRQKACIKDAIVVYKQRIADVPDHAFQARKRELSKLSAEDQWNQLGKME